MLICVGKHSLASDEKICYYSPVIYEREEKQMDKAQKKRLVKVFAVTGSLALVAVSVALLFSYSGKGLPCPINLITGLNCPGCGITRATLAVLQLDFRKAFSMNAMFLVEYAYLLYMYILASVNYVRKGKAALDSPPSWKWIDIAALVLILGWGIVRNIFGW